MNTPSPPTLTVRPARIDVLVGKVETSITMLREYWTALISATVTGKIDVLGWEKNETGQTDA